ncbi:MAG: SH3 domain-containing protein [Sarcina sp.]
MKRNNLRRLLVATFLTTGVVCGNYIDVLASDMKTAQLENEQIKRNGYSNTIINGIKINKQLINRNYEKGIRIIPKYIVIHDTDNRAATANAMANRNYFANHENARASAHYIVDDSNIVQALEDSWMGWHIGDGPDNGLAQNNNSIGIELAVNIDGNFDKTYQNGIALTKYLMNKYNISPENVIMHNDASGKICSKMMIKDRPGMWQEFKRQIGSTNVVKESIEKEEVKKDEIKKEETNDVGVNMAKKGKIIDVSTQLNVRSGPSTAYNIINAVPRDKLVSVNYEKDGWYNITYDGKVGFVSKSYIRLVNSDIEISKNESKKNEGTQNYEKGKIVNVETNLNVRSGIGTNNSVIGYLLEDTIVKVLNSSNGWYKIEFDTGYNVKTGYISGEYLEVI